MRRGLWLLAALVVAPAAADSSSSPVSEVAPGVYLMHGAQEESTASNLGAIANIGFIVGSRCVAVIDTGGSLAVGRRLRQAISARTDKPVCYVINTHVHPDHVLGNPAFEADRPTFVGHHRLPAALAARGATYLATLERELGEAGAGSAAVPPTLLVRAPLDLDLGGRLLRLAAWPTAHTDNDLTVTDLTTNTLWLSDLLFVERIPVLDGKLRGWLGVLGEIERTDAARLIPGHGPVQTGRAGIDAERRYLQALLAGTRAAIRDGRTLRQAQDSVAWGEKPKWLLFDAYHRRNVAAAYAELEWEDE